MEIEAFLQIDEISIFFKKNHVNQDPDAPTLVFLHDALGSTAQWNDFPKLLSETTVLNAVVFDRPGHGRSSAISKPGANNYMHYEALKVLPFVLEKLNIKKPILIGHSDGGSIALLYAAVYEPAAIVCEAAHIFVEKETLNGIRAANDKREVLIEKLKRYHGEKTEMLFDFWANTWLNTDFKDWNIEAELEKITCPTFALQGENDEYATTLHLEKIKEGIGANAQSFLITNCGHAPHIQAKEEILEILAHFIQSFIGIPIIRNM